MYPKIFRIRYRKLHFNGEVENIFAWRLLFIGKEIKNINPAICLSGHNRTLYVNSEKNNLYSYL